MYVCIGVITQRAQIAAQAPLPGVSAKDRPELLSTGDKKDKHKRQLRKRLKSVVHSYIL